MKKCESENTLFFTRNLLYLIVLLLLGVKNIVFLLCVQVLHKAEDNGTNSFCGLCFIFSPIFGFIMSSIALISEKQLVMPETEEFEILHILVRGYTIMFISSVVHGIVICSLISTTKKDDSAYSGLIDREIW